MHPEDKKHIRRTDSGEHEELEYEIVGLVLLVCSSLLGVS